MRLPISSCRTHGGAPGAATALADSLEVDSGFELAVAAALDGRLGAALAADRDQAARLLDRAGADGGAVLVAADLVAPGAAPAPVGAEGAERLADRVRGDSDAAKLARILLRETWVLDSIDALPEGFDAVAVTPAGRVWSPRAHELRQAPALGEERVLAERNRREQLIRASEAAVQAEVSRPVPALERAAGACTERDAERERAVAADRAAIRDRDEAAEEERRLGRADRAPAVGPR